MELKSMKNALLFFTLLLSLNLYSQDVNTLVLDKSMYNFQLSNPQLWDNPIDLYVRSNVITTISFQSLQPQNTDASISATTKTEYTESNSSSDISRKVIIKDYHLSLKKTSDNKNSYYILIPANGNISSNYLNISLNINGKLKNLVFHLIPNIENKGVINLSFVNDLSIASKTDVSLSINQCLSYMLLSNILKTQYSISDTNLSLTSRYLIITDDKVFLSFEIKSVDGNTYFIPDNLSAIKVNNINIDVSKNGIYCNDFYIKPPESSRCIIELSEIKSQGFTFNNLSIQFGNLLLESSK